MNHQRNRQIVEFRRRGIGPREIARRMSLTVGTVIGVLDRDGLCEPQANIERERIAIARAVKASRINGLSFSAIAATHDVSKSTAYRYCRDIA